MEVPEFFQAAGFCLPEKRQIHYSSSSAAESKPINAAGDHFAVEDLFDFSNDDAVLTDAALEIAHSTDSSTVTVADASFLPPDAVVGPRNIADSGNFSGELGVPYEDLAELEWLSNFVEESFSSEDLQKLQLISGHQARPDETPRNNPIFDPVDVAVPGKARSKRSRAAAPCKWASPLIAPSPATSSSESDAAAAKKTPKKKEQEGGGEGRKCVHCATDKTPQWRTGPMGPKTLCNACGVRYKSGRLVPEYRPAASPTFVLTKHSNSHRKVMELRRQKEMQVAQQQQQFMHHHHQTMMFDGDDFLIHHPDFRQLI